MEVILESHETEALKKVLMLTSISLQTMQKTLLKGDKQLFTHKATGLYSSRSKSWRY
jgi:hypothetical protein